MRIKSIFARFTLIALVGCTSVPPASDIPANIANASTPADNQRIADYFAKKAADYDAEAAFHEKMASSYAGRPKGDYASMAAHCRSLRDKFTSAALEARDMEKAHRQMAENPSK